MPYLSNDKIFIIIPVYNENAGLLQRIIHDLLENSYSVVLVDDASTEPVSPGVHERVFHLRHLVNLGQGAALQTGIEFALSRGADYLVTFDADGQHAHNDIPALLQPLKEGEADIAFASRFMEQGHHNATTRRRLLLKLACRVNYLFTGIKLTDAHNGLRALTGKAASKIVLKENRMAHATEFLFLIKKEGLRLKEVPARVIYTEYSRSKGQSGFSSIRIVFDLFLHKLFE